AKLGSFDSLFFFSSRRRHTRSKRDWSSDVCSSDLCSADPATSAAHERPVGRLLARPPRPPHHHSRSARRTPPTSPADRAASPSRSEEHTSELQSRFDLVCRLLPEKKKASLSKSQ